MGTLADQLKAETAAPGSGRLKASLGVRKPADDEADYKAARAQAEAGFKKSDAWTKGIEDTLERVRKPVADALGNVGLDWLAPEGDTTGRVQAIGAGGVGPIMGEVAGGSARLLNAAQNYGRRKRGEPEVSGDAAYRAYRDAMDAHTKALSEAHPAYSAAGMVGGLKYGGEALEGAGGLLGGLKPVAAAVERVKATAPMMKAAKTARALKLASQLKFTPQVVDWAERTGGAALEGAKAMGLLGGLSGEGGEERAGNVVEGAGWGALGGGVFGGIGLPILGMAGKGGMDLARYFGGKLLKPPPEGHISPAEIAAAKKTIAGLAQRNNVTAANVGQLAAPYTDPVLGQVLGTEGQNLTSAVARRGGATGNTMRALQFQRALARPAEIKGAVQEHLGYSPDEANAIVNQTVKAGQETVAPMYAAAEESPFGVTRPDLEQLLTSTTGKGLLSHVAERAKLKGWNPEGLTYAPVEVPPGPGAPVAASPMEAPLVGERIIPPGEAPPQLPPPPDVKVSRGPAEAPGRGFEFLQWLARQGGVMNEGGEMAAMDLSKLGQRSRNANTAGLDELTMKARDAGYWPTEGEPPTHGEFLEQVRKSAAGQHRYALQPEEGAQARFEARQAGEGQQRSVESEHSLRQAEADEAFRIKQELQARQAADLERQRAEVGPEREDYQSLEPPGGEAPPEGYPGQPAPQYEPAETRALTPKSLIHLHQLSRPDYDAAGNLAPGKANQRQADFHAALGRILTGHPETGEGALLPKYQAPKSEAAKYLRLRETYDNFAGKLTGGKVKEWEAMVAGLKDKDGVFDPDKLKGAQLAAVQDVQELWSAGQLRGGGKFQAPGVLLRLSRLFGDAGAKALIEKLGRTAEQAAAESRMAPFSGSRTAEIGAAMGETDQHGVGDLAKVGKIASKGATGVVGELLKGMGAYGKTAGSTVGYRDALGQLLALSGPEQEALLRELETMPAVQPRAPVARELGILGGLPTRRESRSDQLGAMAPR